MTVRIPPVNTTLRKKLRKTSSSTALGAVQAFAPGARDAYKAA
jgi:hypothetical protein